MRKQALTGSSAEPSWPAYLGPFKLGSMQLLVSCHCTETPPNPDPDQGASGKACPLVDPKFNDSAGNVYIVQEGVDKTGVPTCHRRCNLTQVRCGPNLAPVNPACAGSVNVV